MTDPLYLVCMEKNSILKKEGIIVKISYESVEDLENQPKNKTQALKWDKIA